MRMWTIGAMAAVGSLWAGVGQARYGAAGCGLGSVIIGDKPGIIQIFAGTTNGTSGNQTFGITSGTSNCAPEGQAAIKLEQERFVASNLPTLARELAQGGGETVEAFAATLGCRPESLPAFSAHLRANHGEIFRHPGVDGVLGATRVVLSRDAALASACGHAILSVQ